MTRVLGELIESIVQRFERLPERERRMTIILMVVLVVFVVGGSLFWFSASIATKNSQIKIVQKRLFEINSLKSQFQQAKQIADEQEKKFRSNDISLFSLIQNVATRYSLSLYDLNEKKDPVDQSNLIETSVVVNLKEVSVDRLTAFIAELEETEGGMVKVIRLKIKSRYDKSDLLDVQMTVATWKSA